MDHVQTPSIEQSLLDAAVAEGGAYEILHKRLREQGLLLQKNADALNRQRIEEFGKSEMAISDRVRIRTENNCIARDILQVGKYLLFGYNVFIGLKKETRIEDVFSLYTLEETEEGYDVVPASMEGTFLNNPSFLQDFNELYTYYKNTRLLQIMERNGKLLACFQIGARVTDIRVFRWALHKKDATVQVEYIDNRGERDILPPPSHDFEWVRTTRDDAVIGRHSHVNILDTIFVETVGGDLTVKRENNTEDGLGIYREAVLDLHQSLDDAQIEYAKVGSLILLKILPYRETDWRYLIYNTLTHDVQRIDAIGLSCIQLPEDHGIIFPGGYYLQNGDYKTFDQSMEGMFFRKARHSPNGEDVMYIFYEQEAGRFALFTYNMIERKLQNPIFGHGYTFLEDGRMVIFEWQSSDPTRVHPMQIWRTPFFSDEFAAQQPTGSSPLARIGNSNLVRGISDVYNIAREIDAQTVSASRYEKLSADTRRLFDLYYWIKEDKEFDLASVLREIAQTSELVLDEYEKVESIRSQAEQALRVAKSRQKELLSTLLYESWADATEFVEGLNALNRQRGQVITLRSMRYMDLTSVDILEKELEERHQILSEATAEFLAGETALSPFANALFAFDDAIAAAPTVTALDATEKEIEKLSLDLDMLSNLMLSLSFEDTTQQTKSVEAISEVFSRANQSKARLAQRKKELDSVESVAQFSAQFKLLTQSLTNALAQATDPERCDENLSRMLMQLEELETRFSRNENFFADILAKREEIVATFEAHKQTLLDDRQRRAQSLVASADRVLATLPRRLAKFSDLDALNAFFATDPLVAKIRETAQRLRDVKDSVKADDVEARLKAAKDQGIRILRDKQEIYADDGTLIKLGPRHRFSVNTQELDVTLLPHNDALYLHLTGTDYREPIANAELDALREYWNLSLESESPSVYRGEYLAYSMVYAASKNEDGLTSEKLRALLTQPEELTRAVRTFAEPRYREGYEKGIHDHDAALILKALLPLGELADLLRFNPLARGVALLFWQQNKQQPSVALWPEYARNSLGIQRLFASSAGLAALQEEIRSTLQPFSEACGFNCQPYQLSQAAEFLSIALSRTPIEFTFSKYAHQLYEGLCVALEEAHLWGDFEQMQRGFSDASPSSLAQRWKLTRTWLQGLCSQEKFAHLYGYVDEAAIVFLLDDQKDMTLRFSEVDLQVTVSALLGEHPTIRNHSVTLYLDDYFSRMRRQRKQIIPGFRGYHAVRQQILDEQRDNLRINEFKPRPLNSFVRNKLINDVYLPIIGDNMAKQMGTAGEGKRTDLMGLLLFISPPGYGKTTLMEYIAHRLGLIFVKINGPALGHSVLSLDPQNAPDATAAQELQKLNLALEMGNNVMLYVDDIQHTHSEFLQKFISLCDGTRRIEGVWKGKTKTYDMRGKKFCVVMAGNPYTESGDVFTIPDMLANRADVYNLGEVLGGMEEAFALSYIENCLTSNAVLAPLALRDLKDLYQLINKASGKPFTTNDLSYDYTDAEISEITGTLKNLLQIRDVLLMVNQAYIASASQADAYRTEPAFKLQGSYRNMSKLAERVSAVMNAEEVARLIDDHYLGEAQLLTTAAEENLLKLAELRGTLTAKECARWEEIKRGYKRNKSFGGDEASLGDRVVAQLCDIADSMQSIQQEVRKK